MHLRHLLYTALIAALPGCTPGDCGDCQDSLGVNILFWDAPAETVIVELDGEVIGQHPPPDGITFDPPLQRYQNVPDRAPTSAVLRVVGASGREYLVTTIEPDYEAIPDDCFPDTVTCLRAEVELEVPAFD